MSRMTGYMRTVLLGVPFQAFTRDVWLVCLSNIIGAFGEGLYFWLFPLYVRSLQADYIQLGIVYSALYGSGMLAPILGGFLTDRFDRKKISLLAWTPWVFAPLIYSFAQNWQQLVPGAICWGIAMIGLPALNAYVITSVADKEKLASVLSFVWATYSFGFIFAPTVGSYIATFVGMRWVLRLATLLSGAATMVFFFLHSQHPSKNTREQQTNAVSSAQGKRLFRKILMWAGFYMMATFLMSIAKPYVPTFLDEERGFSEIYVGLFGSLNFAGATFLGIAMGRLSDKWRESRAISTCLMLYISSVAMLLLIREPVSLMFAAFLFGGSTVIPPLINSIVGKTAPQSKQGLWISIPQTLSWLGSFTAPYLGGYLYTQSPIYAFIAPIAVLPFLIFVLFQLKS
jgi:MFS family permease